MKVLVMLTNMITNNMKSSIYPTIPTMLSLIKSNGLIMYTTIISRLTNIFRLFIRNVIPYLVIEKLITCLTSNGNYYIVSTRVRDYPPYN